MKKPPCLLRLAAVVSSVLLAGGFVSCRAGAFNWLNESSEGAAGAENKPIPEETMFYSTKTGVISAPSLTEYEPPAGMQPAPAIMSGTKSLSPSMFLPPPQPPFPSSVTEGITPADTELPAAAKPVPAIMGGPKYAPVFVSPSLQWAVPSCTPDAKPPANSPPSKPGR